MKIRILIFLLFIIPGVFAGAPLLTFTPLTPTTVQVHANETVVVQYQVQNESHRSHTWMLKPMVGISQLTTGGACPNPFVLGYQGTCTLYLTINGSQLSGDVESGPVVCQQGRNGQPDPLLCYQPAAVNSLQIELLPTATFYVGAQNGRIYFSTLSGNIWTATTTMPAGGSAVNSIFVVNSTIYVGAANGGVYYSSDNGVVWISATPPDGSSVNAVFVSGSTLYAGTSNGLVYYSTDNGVTWQSTTAPDGSAVNAIFVSGTVIYAGTADGFVYYSTNNGATWTVVNDSPDGFAISNIYLSGNLLYVATAKEYVYTSTAITGGGTWTRAAQTVYRLFVNSSGTSLYAGSQSGFVYSLTTGDELGFVVYSPINAIFVS